MYTTPPTLLERLRRSSDEDAWRRFVHLYFPLLYAWARRLHLQPQDAADLVQDVLTVLFRKLPTFEYDPLRSFRAWLKTVTLNVWRNHRRKPALVQAGDADLDGLAAPDTVEELTDAEYRRQLVSRVLELIRGDFQPATWEVFQECAVRGRPTAEVAAERGLSLGTVRAAKFRVLARLRQELAGLLD